MNPRRARFALPAILASSILFVACGSDDSNQGAGASGTTTTGAGGEGAGNGGGACLLHNCNSDEECAGCAEGRTSCLVSEHRCVACGQNGKGCPDGQGVPQITCNTSADCGACDPMHQVCDTAKHACVACTATDTSECQSTDICDNGSCAPACPKTCHLDGDCNKCGSAESPAHACNAHKCSECSPTYACPAGEKCTENGVCIKPCGIDGAVEGTCDSDADCTGCGATTNETYTCEFPINGAQHGKCVLTAPGCSDLGQGTVVLPDPWNKVTNLCSNDGDCAGVGIDLNVGKILRDLTGIDEINDANVTYSMNQCAEIELAGNVSCGVCVPCSVDADCTDVDIDQFALEAFGPIGSIAAAILLDQVFGNNPHKIYMYCETVGAGYGVCAPCPGLLNDCSVGGGGGGSGTCDHEPTTTGGPLDPDCDACAADVCAVDSYCCTTDWDSQCVSEVAQYCSSAACDHDECTNGNALADDCSACTTAICAADPYCCQTAWDDQCVSEAGAEAACNCP